MEHTAPEPMHTFSNQSNAIKTESSGVKMEQKTTIVFGLTSALSRLGRDAQQPFMSRKK